MNLPELSINRHVMAYMMSAVLVLFGIIGYQRLGVDQFPNVDIPVISVTTVQPGANPSIVDASVTSILERQVNSVPGIENIRSSSTPSVSVIAINFELSKDIDVAFNEVQAKVNQVLNQLPDDADPPVVAKVETDARPIMWLALRGNRTLQQLNVYADEVLRRQLENIQGVGDIQIGGLRERTIRVEVNPQKLAAYGLAASDLVNAFRSEHLLLPGGFLVADRTEDLLKLDLEYHDAAELREMVIAQRNGSILRLEDVAEVVDGLADFRSLARFNGEPTVGLGIVKVSGTNTVEIIEAVKDRLANEIRPQLPPGMNIEIASDDSRFILDMVNALLEHLVLGTVLAALIVAVFLRNLRSTVMIAAAIPVSLLGAVAVMYFFGYTINNITLLALLLLIGVVVDDAIVVLENIYRHREDIDPDPKSAALNGTQEVMFAVLAATLSLVSIFLPVVFMGGMIGRFFESFAVVVVVGVLISWFVALSLTPMMCSRYLRVHGDHGPVFRAFEAGFDAVDNAYRWLLRAALNHRLVTMLIGVAVVASSYFFFANVGGTFVPPQDRGEFMVNLKTPLGASIHYTNDKLAQIEEILGKEPSVASYFTAVGLGRQGQVTSGIAFVQMVPRGEREVSQQQVTAGLNRRMAQIAGAEIFVTEVPVMGGQRGEPLQFMLRGANLQEVDRYANEFERRLKAIEGMGSVDLALQLDMPQVTLTVDRDRAAQLGLSTAQIGQAVNILAGGLDVARFNDARGNSDRYDVRLKAGEDSFETIEDLTQIFLRSRSGELVRLDTVARLAEELGPAEITRYNLQFAAPFYVNPGMPLAAAVAELERLERELLPAGYSIQLTGQAEELQDTMSSVLFALAVAIILLYMVLASQFDSFLQPIILMTALPLAAVGGVAALWLLGYTLNIFSMIGLLLLIGLVAKNSILLVDLTNQRRDEGMEIREALEAACPIRLRPVLMTSLTVIFALLPAALGAGAGADTNGPLAAAVIGGMISSTLLTLVIVPVAYSLLEGVFERIEGERGGQAASPGDQSL